MNTTASRGSSADLVRQIVVISTFVFMIIAALVGVGVFGGTPVEDAQGGVLDTDGSYLAPAGTAFSIWSVIYLGLAAYTVWQALPGQRGSARQRAVGGWVAATMVLNGGWLVTVQFATSVWWSVVVIAALLVVLCLAFVAAVRSRRRTGGVVDALLVDGVTGLHLGWVSLATVANAAAALTATGDPAWERAADAWGIAVLVVVGLVGAGIALATGGRVAPGIALAWGLSWVAVERATGAPESMPIAVTAAIVAAVVIALPLVLRGVRGATR